MSEFPPVVFIDVYQSKPRNRPNVTRPQTWRWRAISEGNGKKLASGEAYTNLADLLDTVVLLFGDNSTVYLRQPEQGDRVLRMAVPL